VNGEAVISLWPY